MSGKAFGNKNHLIHGGHGTRLYRIWKSMRQRCNDPNCSNAYRYQHRGITVCTEWDDFSKFREWALLNGYDDSLTIDRINNDLGYFPGNCRWATYKEQNNNRRDNVRIQYKDKSYTIAQLAALFNVDYKSFWYYLKKFNSIEVAANRSKKAS